MLAGGSGAGTGSLNPWNSSLDTRGDPVCSEPCAGCVEINMVQHPTESLNRQFCEGAPSEEGRVFPHIDIESSDLNVSWEKIENSPDPLMVEITSQVYRPGSGNNNARPTYLTGFCEDQIWEIFT